MTHNRQLQSFAKARRLRKENDAEGVIQPRT